MNQKPPLRLLTKSARVHFETRRNGKQESSRFGRLVFAVLAISLGISACSSNDTNGSRPTASPTAATASATPSMQPTPKTAFKSGEAVPAGYFGYKVYDSWFNDHPEPTKGKPAGDAAGYLVVDMSIANTDDKERKIIPVLLVDEQGQQYSPDEKSWKSTGSFGQIGKLAPASSKRAFVIFAAPRGRHYKLKLQGFSANEALTIDLTPQPAPPK